jgi:hypothetical protein
MELLWNSINEFKLIILARYFQLGHITPCIFHNCCSGISFDILENEESTGKQVMKVALFYLRIYNFYKYNKIIKFKISFY